MSHTSGDVVLSPVHANSPADARARGCVTSGGVCSVLTDDPRRLQPCLSSASPIIAASVGPAAMALPTLPPYSHSELSHRLWNEAAQAHDSSPPSPSVHAGSGRCPWTPSWRHCFPREQYHCHSCPYILWIKHGNDTASPLITASHPSPRPAPGGLNGLRGAPPPAPRPLPLLPAIDTLHCFLKRGQTTLLSAAAGTAHTPPPVHGSRGGSGSSGSGSVPLAVRQMISRQATIETIHRAERVSHTTTVRVRANHSQQRRTGLRPPACVPPLSGSQAVRVAGACMCWRTSAGPRQLDLVSNVEVHLHASRSHQQGKQQWWPCRSLVSEAFPVLFSDCADYQSPYLDNDVCSRDSG